MDRVLFVNNPEKKGVTTCLLMSNEMENKTLISDRRHLPSSLVR